ncbi:MAG TPA: zinc-ribbon domain-containing protein, partial [Gemmataceae bacterium]|nr:zinc-ribbon domain-containing protein [Gemmataceae bacterium]
MPARIHCPQCQTAFAFSPALVGKMVRCKKCQHTFAVTAPPEEAEPVAAAPAVPDSPKPAGPPPLPPSPPPSRAGRDERDDADDRPVRRGFESDRDDADDPPVRRRSDDDRPRRRPEPIERSSGVLMLTLLIAGVGLGFLVLAAGIGFILWPSSTPDPSVANLPPPSQTTAMARVEPPPRMPAPPPIEAAPRAPVGAGTPRPAGTPAPAFTPADPPGFKEVVPPVKGTPPRFPEPPPPVGPAEVKPPANKSAPRWHPVAAVPIKPAPLKQDREERKLPSAIDDVCVGGGGRFLFLSLPQSKQVAIFDVNEAKIVKFLPVPSTNARIAAGMDKLFVADPAEGLIQRYSLFTFEKEITVQLPAAPAGAKVDALVTGSAVNGPILVGYSAREKSGGSGVLVDPVTFQEVNVEFPNRARFPTFTPYLARASADGRTFVIHDGHGGEPHALKVITLNGSTGKVSGEVWPAPASLGNPSPDGSLIYTAGGVFNPDLRDVTGGK